jgi:hypothetical protein
VPWWPQEEIFGDPLFLATTSGEEMEGLAFSGDKRNHLLKPHSSYNTVVKCTYDMIINAETDKNSSTCHD